MLNKAECVKKMNDIEQKEDKERYQSMVGKSTMR